ncbi:hypothetical protein ACA910_002223 [Epithemia clementina (nom. ined.)]
MEQDTAKSKANKKPTNVSLSKEAAASATAKKPDLATKQQSTKKLGTFVQKVGTRQQQPTPMATPNNKDTNKKEEEVDEFPVNVPC